MTTPYMAALTALDERQEEVQVFVSPLGDQSTEIDAAAETAVFVARPDYARGIEPKSVSIEVKGGSNQRSAFAEAAGLYL
ncbi:MULTISPECIES: hypothetical protein [Pseudomonadota]|jgi:hypothetical protein|uniref:Uncharacterized protein n=1 Tax=Eoetvoesiella caeni TaxID=645616 RepID=A0A366HES8_9BURK|nr:MULTISPECIES: hypothetical protein [Pseudomonadota]MCI2808521.1 hypothetical protein [Eoetvoesiella caeni]NYT55061.1 hypothetical protein [Eoetvoesiella caeni]QPL36722.1 hypothetical protein IT971_05265 [Thalassospira sp. B30-1]RBP40961.1 hypothetical protein DFR37_103305 [Eoetvoesiella caeni]